MSSYLRILLSILPLLSYASPGVVSSPRGHDHGGPSPRSLYIMSNKDQNAVIAMSVASDGSLSGGTSHASGGSGGALIDFTTGKPHVPDSLSIQDSVVVAWPYLFTVNAGSNSVSQFLINVQDPTQLSLLGPPQNSNGYFPTALAVSPRLGVVCVGNTGVPSGVACAKYGKSGLSAFDSLRPLDVGITANPPIGPIPGIGDLLFDEDNNVLLAMVKGNGMTTKGYVAVYPINGNSVSETAQEISPNGTAVLFGSEPIPGTSRIFASDASIGGAILDLNDLANPIALTKIPGQQAACWARITSSGQTGIISDAGLNRLTEVDLSSGAIIAYYEPGNANQEMSDFEVVGNTLWALSANNGTVPATVTTIALGPDGGLQGAKTVQTYVVPDAGPRTMGLVVA